MKIRVSSVPPLDLAEFVADYLCIDEVDRHDPNLTDEIADAYAERTDRTAEEVKPEIEYLLA